MKKSKFLKRTKKIGLLSTFATGSILAGCSDTSISSAEKPTSPPDDTMCDEYVYDEKLDVWECKENETNRSHSNGHFFFYNGVWHNHKNKSSLKSSSSYKNYSSSKSKGFSSGKSGGFFGG